MGILDLPIIGSVLSTGGEIYSAQQNKAEAERNRQFQERMSSTAVQRSVEDYKAAGLNPALAYDRSASSPGGAQANIGNPLRDVVSNATTIANARQGLELARQQNEADLRVKNAQAAQLTAAATRESQTASNLFFQQARDNQLWNFAQALQPHELRTKQAGAIMAELQNQMTRLQLPGAQNQAAMEEMFKKVGGSTGLSGARSFLTLMKTLFGNTR